jgi:hypothetical protein
LFGKIRGKSLASVYYLANAKALDTNTGVKIQNIILLESLLPKKKRRMG